MTYGILSTINILLKSEAFSSRVLVLRASKPIDTINNNSFIKSITHLIGVLLYHSYKKI
jgi:hypothetical protein